MEFARLETATLKDVNDDYYYGCSCTSCLHSARLSLSKLRAHLGENFPLVKVKDRLRCERCNSWQIAIKFLTPNQKTGNVAQLLRGPLWQ